MDCKNELIEKHFVCGPKRTLLLSQEVFKNYLNLKTFYSKIKSYQDGTIIYFPHLLIIIFLIYFSGMLEMYFWSNFQKKL